MRRVMLCAIVSMGLFGRVEASNPPIDTNGGIGWGFMRVPDGTIYTGGPFFEPLDSRYFQNWGFEFPCSEILIFADPDNPVWGINFDQWAYSVNNGHVVWFDASPGEQIFAQVVARGIRHEIESMRAFLDAGHTQHDLVSWQPVPEPSSLLVLAAGGLLAFRRR